MVPDLGSLCGVFWGVHRCVQIHVHAYPWDSDQPRVSLLSGSPPWFLSLGLSASLELTM